MKISVIIPTYKPQAYLWECLDSVVAQTFPKEDFELILVLNGCTEPWKSQIQEYMDSKMKGMNVKFIHTEQGGVSNARNMALDVAEGDYITFIDDDDFVSCNYLEGLYEKADIFTISLAKMVAFDDVSRTVLKHRIYNVFEKYESKKNVSVNQVRKYLCGPCIKLIPKEIVGNRRFDVSFKNGEDSLFMYLVSDKYKRFSFTSNNAIYYRRIRENSACTMYRSNFRRTINGIRLLYNVLKIYVPNFWRYNLLFSITTMVSTINGIRH